MYEKRRVALIWILTAFVAFLPLSVSISSKIKALPMATLFLVGLYLLFTRADTRLRYRLAGAVVAVCLLRFVFAAANIGGHGLGWPTLDLPAQTLLFVGMAAVFTLPLHWRFIWLGLALSAIVLGGASMVQHYMMGFERSYGLNGGTWSAIEFAMVTLVLVLFSMIRLLCRETPTADRWLHALAVVVGIYGALLTQSRGPLLTFAPTLLLVIGLHVKRTGEWRRAAFALGIVVLGMGTVTVSLHNEIARRFTEVQGEMDTFSRSNASGAVRERMEMWITAWRAFEQHPWAGVGIDQFGAYSRQQVTAGLTNAAISKYEHPHSEYLESLSTGGIPGLLVLLALFVAPLWYFGRRVLAGDPTMATTATAGFVLVVMYLCCGLTDNVFYRAMPQSFFLFLLLGLSLRIAMLTSPRLQHPPVLGE
jgi:O-antigen ligase